MSEEKARYEVAAGTVAEDAPLTPAELLLVGQAAMIGYEVREVDSWVFHIFAPNSVRVGRSESLRDAWSIATAHMQAQEGWSAPAPIYTVQDKGPCGGYCTSSARPGGIGCHCATLEPPVEPSIEQIMGYLTHNQRKAPTVRWFEHSDDDEHWIAEYSVPHIDWFAWGATPDEAIRALWRAVVRQEGELA